MEINNIKYDDHDTEIKKMLSMCNQEKKFFQSDKRRFLHSIHILLDNKCKKEKNKAICIASIFYLFATGMGYRLMKEHSFLKNTMIDRMIYFHKQKIKYFDSYFKLFFNEDDTAFNKHLQKFQNQTTFIDINASCRDKEKQKKKVLSTLMKYICENGYFYSKEKQKA